MARVYHVTVFASDHVEGGKVYFSADMTLEEVVVLVREKPFLSASFVWRGVVVWVNHWKVWLDRMDVSPVRMASLPLQELVSGTEKAFAAVGV